MFKLPSVHSNNLVAYQYFYYCGSNNTFYVRIACCSSRRMYVSIANPVDPRVPDTVNESYT